MVSKLGIVAQCTKVCCAAFNYHCTTLLMNDGLLTKFRSVLIEPLIILPRLLNNHSFAAICLSISVSRIQNFGEYLI